MKQVIVFSPEEADGCSFYRGLGVLGELHRKDIMIRRSPRFVHWAELCDCDIGFMQRPYSQKHVEIAKMIKQQMPLWIDYDDDLFNVPECNPSYELYSRPEVQEAMQQLKELADIITVSAKGVQESFGGQIIPNAYNDYRLPTNYAPRENNKKVVLWRGTESHVGDLLAFKKELDDLIALNKDCKFVFFGFNPWMLDTSDRDVSYIPSQDIYSYQRTLEVINPDALIVPLEDNRLNRAKSNVAWLETSRFGTRCVAPDFDPWSWSSIALYPETKLFCRSFDFALRQGRDSFSWEYIQNNLFLSQINQKRLDIIGQLLS